MPRCASAARRWGAGTPRVINSGRPRRSRRGSKRHRQGAEEQDALGEGQGRERTGHCAAWSLQHHLQLPVSLRSLFCSQFIPSNATSTGAGLRRSHGAPCPKAMRWMCITLQQQAMLCITPQTHSNRHPAMLCITPQSKRNRCPAHNILVHHTANPQQQAGLCITPQPPSNRFPAPRLP